MCVARRIESKLVFHSGTDAAAAAGAAAGVVAGVAAGAAAAASAVGILSCT